MGYGRAALWGIVAALVVLILGVVGVVFVAPGMRSPMEVPGERTMVVVASRGGTDGSQVAQLVGILDTSGGRLVVELVDPLSTVTVPGTSYDRLRDAYPFGGGAGVSGVWAAAQGTEAVPVVSVPQEALVRAVEAVGGVVVDVPYEASVFDGDRLTILHPGERRLGGTELVALLESAEYRQTTAEQMRVRSAVASGVAEALREEVPDLGGVSSSLRAEDLRALGARLRELAPALVLEPYAP